MYRVLHIMFCADVGGISAVLINYYRYIDRSKIQFDIGLTIEQVGLNGQRLRELGAEFYRLPTKSKGIRAFEQALTMILNSRHYDAIHVHENETSYVALRVAKKCGVKQRFAHSHTSSPYYSVKGEIRRLSGCVLNAHYATCVIGCGKLAGERVFGKWNMKRSKAVVLPNAIDTQVFEFNEAVRNEARHELGLDGKYVIGMVGRLSPEKNHAYALHIVGKLHEIMPDAVFVIVGNGDEEARIREIIVKQDMGDYVQMLGRRGDVNRLYQAFDALLMPSIHEGFPVAAVEALAAGLPVLLSSSITKELSFGSAVCYIDLNDDDKWINTLMEFRHDHGRKERIGEVSANGLDVRTTAKMLEELYLGSQKAEKRKK